MNILLEELKQILYKICKIVLYNCYVGKIYEVDKMNIKINSIELFCLTGTVNKFILNSVNSVLSAMHKVRSIWRWCHQTRLHGEMVSTLVFNWRDPWIIVIKFSEFIENLLCKTSNGYFVSKFSSNFKFCFIRKCFSFHQYRSTATRWN